MFLNDFSGGLNLRPEPDKLNNITAVKYSNINHERGSILSLNKPKEILLPLINCDNTILQGKESEITVYNSEKIEYSIGYFRNGVDGLAEKEPRMYRYLFTQYNPDTDEMTKASPQLLVGSNLNTPDILLRMNVSSLLFTKGFIQVRIFRYDYPYTSKPPIGNLDFRLIDTVNLNIGDNQITYRDNIPSEHTSDIIITTRSAVAYNDDPLKTSHNVIECVSDSRFFEANQYHTIIGMKINNDNTMDYPQMITFAQNDSDTTYCSWQLTQLNNSAKTIKLFDWYNGQWALFETINSDETTARTEFENIDEHPLLPPETKGEYTHISNYTNIIQGSYKPINCNSVTNIDDKFTYSTLKHSIIPHSINGSVIDFKGWVYIFDGTRQLMNRADRDDWLTIGLQKPIINNKTINIDTMQTEPLEVSYRITYYNSIYDIESEPTDVVNIKRNAYKITTSFALSNNTEITADKIRLYRLGKGLINYTLCNETDINTGIITDVVTRDTISSIAGNNIILGLSNIQPLPNLKYVIATNTILLGAINDKLYFSDIGKPYSWSRDNYIDFDTDITGIGVVANGIIVFTLNETYIIVGNDPTTFAKYLISKEIGCINHNTIKPYNNGIVWCSYDGIYYTNGGVIKNLSRDVLSTLQLENKTINAEVINDQYHLALNTDDIFKHNYYNPENKPIILVLDNRYNAIIRTIEQDVTWLGKKGADLIFKLDNKFYDLYPIDTDYRQLHYVSGQLKILRFSERKHFKDLYITYKGDFIIKVTGYTENSKRILYEKSLPTDKQQYNLKLRHDIEVYALEIELTGKGYVTELDFVPSRRSQENGK